jgi:hypothetical protein
VARHGVVEALHRPACSVYDSERDDAGAEVLELRRCIDASDSSWAND